MKFIHYQRDNPEAPLSIRETADPEPGADEVLLHVAATSLNRADLLRKRSKYPGIPGVSDELGLDVAGTIIGVGSAVTGFEVGDNVCALVPGGGFAQQIAVDHRMVLRLPERLSFTKAAAIPEVFLTAYQTLFQQAEIQAGERVLIHAGASGVGTAAIQLVRKAGAIPIVTSSGHKHQALYDLGAEHCIDYRQQSFDEAVLDVTNGKGADVIIDVVGAPYSEKNIRCINTDGRIIALALMGGRYVENFDMSPIILKRIKLIGTTLRDRPVDYKRDLMAGFRREIWPAFAERDLQPVVDTIYDWEDVNEAFAYMESNANVGKIVITIGE